MTYTHPATNIRLSHIAPTAFLGLTTADVFHMTLGHLVQAELESGQDTPYIDFYRQRKAEYGCEILMDNSLFEIYQHGVNGGNLYTTKQMITFGTAIDADILVMVDHGGQPAQLTIDTAKEQGPIFKSAGFKTMFVPQSEKGELEDFIRAFEWAVSDEGADCCDFIAMSIIGAPNALGDIERDNKLQRFLARWKMMNILTERGLIQKMMENGQKMHFLGALDGWSGEIELMRDSGFAHNVIYSWDTSQAIWHGLNGVAFDNSPTGLLGGKLALEVDFDVKREDYSEQQVVMAVENVINVNRLTTNKLTEMKADAC